MTVQEIYEIALALMNEPDQETYRSRVPVLLSSLIGRVWQFSEEHEFGPHSMFSPVSALTDTVEGLDRTLMCSVLPYGLAALLYLDEDPARANSWWGIFSEELDLCARNRPAAFERIENAYGGPEHGQFGRW